jgi:hypothetical protein
MSHAEGESDGRGRTRLIAGAVALVALLGVVFARNLTDFSVYYTAGQSLLSGRTDLYAPDFARGVVMDYRYLPFFILVFAPLSLVPYTLAAWVWHLLDTIAIVIAVASIASLYTELPYNRAKVWWTAFLVVVPYFAMALDYGNVHLITTALMFAGFSLALRRRELPAAALLAIAATVKIVPALTLPYFVVKRRFKLLGLVVIITAAINLLPSLYFGLAGNRDLVERWYEHVIAGQEFHETNGPINLSLKGQLRRTFTAVDYTKRVDGDHRYPAVNIAAAPQTIIDRVWLTVSAGAFLAGLVLVWRSPRMGGSTTGERDDVRVEALRLGLMICLLLFVGPLTSKTYLVALLWPVIAVGVAGWHDAAIRRTLIVIAILSSALPLVPGRTVQRLLLVAGTDFYVTCAILGLVVFTLMRWSSLSRSNAASSSLAPVHPSSSPPQCPRRADHR